MLVGVPFINSHGSRVLAKMEYEHNEVLENEALRDGDNSWYMSHVFFSVGQAIGRAVRSQADYCGVVLLDCRWVVRTFVASSLRLHGV